MKVRIGSFVCFLSCISFQLFGGTNPAFFDADEYLYYGTYNSIRTPFYVGVNDVQSGSPYQYHFNFAAVKFDLAGITSGAKSYLQLNLMRFRVPGVVDPSYQGPPSFSYATNGYNFDLKVVALDADFSDIDVLETTDLLQWYQDHLWNRPTIGTMSFNSAGSGLLDVSSAVEAWLTNPPSNYGFGLVGSSGSAQGLTAQFYSSDYTNDPSKSPALIQNALGVTESLLVSWRQQNGFSAQADLSQDSDGDGLSDLMEFFLNRNPHVPDAKQAFTSKIEGDQLVFQFNRRDGGNLGVSWEVRSSESLTSPIETWSTITIYEGSVTNGFIPCSARLAISNAKQFMRLVLRETL